MVCRSALFGRRSRSLGFWGPLALWPLTLQAGKTSISRRKSREIPKLLTWSVNCEIGLTTDFVGIVLDGKVPDKAGRRRRHNKLTSAAGREEGGWVSRGRSPSFLLSACFCANHTTRGARALQPTSILPPRNRLSDHRSSHHSVSNTRRV